MAELIAKAVLLPLDAEIEFCGQKWTIGAVGWVGDRYYWLTQEDCRVAMIPASTIEGSAVRRSPGHDL